MRSIRSIVCSNPQPPRAPRRWRREIVERVAGARRADPEREKMPDRRKGLYAERPWSAGHKVYSAHGRIPGRAHRRESSSTMHKEGAGFRGDDEQLRHRDFTRPATTGVPLEEYVEAFTFQTRFEPAGASSRGNEVDQERDLDPGLRLPRAGDLLSRPLRTSPMVDPSDIAHDVASRKGDDQSKLSATAAKIRLQGLHPRSVRTS